MITNIVTKVKTVTVNEVEYDVYSKPSGLIGNSDPYKTLYFAVKKGDDPKNDNSIMKGLLTDSVEGVISFIKHLNDL